MRVRVIVKSRSTVNKQQIASAMEIEGDTPAAGSYSGNIVDVQTDHLG